MNLLHENDARVGQPFQNPELPEWPGLVQGVAGNMGKHVFQFVLEKRPKQPKTYVIPDA